MSVLDLLQQPWAITPPKLEAMTTVYERHAAGERFDAKAAAASIGFASSSGKDPAYTVDQGVAIVPLQGIMAKKMDLFTAISGGMSTQGVIQALQDANADTAVSAILLDIDSPGGEVDGTQQLADAVSALTKPVVAFADGQCCSAAMWVASKCQSIWAASDTTQVGSISVVMSHTDRSKQNDARGVKVTHITTGKYKRMLNSDQPLSQEGLAYGQDRMDYLHTLFVDAVADGRGVASDQAQAKWSEGQVFFAQEAVDNGLIDGIISREELVSRLVAADSGDEQAQKQLHTSATHYQETQNMATPFKTFATEADYNAAIEQATASAKPAQAQLDALKAEGATAERERIAAIHSTPYAAQYPEVVASLVADGKSGKPEAALAILAADARVTKDAGAARIAEMPGAAASSVPDAKKEGEAAASAAGGEAAKSAAFDAALTPKAIQDHIAQAKTAGRTIGPADAVAEMRAAALAK